MATVSFKETTRVHPRATRPAVDHLNLEVDDGEFLVLVGPSGCGKTTSLRMLAGLEDIDEGTICIDGRDVADVAPRARDIAMVFQNYALYPHMTVAENMGFALKIARVNKGEIKARVRKAAEILDLEDYLDRRPGQLSGGQRQRVAMGRAIVREPRVFLMDEPLSNLDAQLRVSTRSQIAALQRRLGVTTLYVTHDQVEAMTMGDRVAVMKDGVLQQCDTPRALFQAPVNAFVAGFIGSPAMNLLNGTLELDGVAFGTTIIPVPLAIRERPESRTARNVTVGFRPESLELVARRTRLPGRRESRRGAGLGSVRLRATRRSRCSVGDRRGRHHRPRRASRQPAIGELIHLRVKRDALYLFDSESGKRFDA